MVTPSTLCSSCGGEAVYLQHYSGRAFCRKCYLRAFEKRVKDQIDHRRLLRPDDRIAVAVSGGKDSVSLLHVLSRIEEKFPKASLVAVSVDEGIDGYRDEALEIAAQNAEKLGIEHHILSFRSLYGHSMDDISELVRSDGRWSICAFCGIFRRKAFNVVARDRNATVLATAHNLDDEAQSLLMSILRGDANSVSKYRGPVSGFVRRVKPFSTILEREIALYAYLRGFRFQSIPCPYAGSSFRNEVRAFLDVVEKKHPGMKFNVQTTIERMIVKTREEKGPMNTCASCGEPSSSLLCRSCQALRELGIL